MINKFLINEINKLISKLSYTDYINNRLRDLLIKYEYCRHNKVLHYPYNIEDIDLDIFNRHLIGFIDGDGSLRSGKRVGHKKGLYRFVPNLVIKLDKVDLNYLQLVVQVLNFKNINVYKTYDTN